MANEMVPQGQQQVAQLCTIDQGTLEGKMRCLAIIGGNSEAGKDWLPANKRTELEIDDIIIAKTEEWVKDDGEIVAPGWRATCVLRSGDMVHFSSYRVVQYLRACLSMWAANWQGIVLAFVKSTANGKTTYKVEYVREGDWRD